MDFCIFCSIISQKTPASIELENNSVIVLKDIAPKAPIHLLIIPKMHIEKMSDIETETMSYIQEMTKITKKLSIKYPHFNLICNNGSEAGQRVMHLHWHFMSGIDFFAKYL